MARRIRLKSVAVAAALLCSFAPSAGADTTLVSYNFDYDVLDSGPDTYQVFRHGNAKAEVSAAYAGGGYASAHLTDEARDGDFVEFQGYFPEQRLGSLRFRFKFLIANPNNLFNIALVGTDRYQLAPLGINFWLSYQDGWLRHTSDSIPKKLYQPNLYEWYALDALLDLSKGTYSLRIARESGEVAIQVDKQPFATGAGRNYSLKEYSFVGDLADAQPADFYIDDVSIATSNEIKLSAHVAPGRRKYFFEIWDDYHRQLQGRLRCLPAKNLEDFGISSREYAALAANRELGILQRLTRDNPEIGKSEDWLGSVELSAIVDWHNACAALDAKDFAKAREHIAAALDKKPSAYIYLLTGIIVDAATSTDWNSLYSRAYSLPQREVDHRNQVALAMIAFHGRRFADVDQRRNADTALARLGRITSSDATQLKTLGMQAINSGYVAQLRRYLPETWEQSLQWMVALEQHYYAALWQGNHSEAREIAKRTAAKLAAHSIPPGIWREREADGAFLARDFDTALDLYNSLVPMSLGSQLKMADAYHIQGDLQSEKSIRESIYRSFSVR